MLGLMSMAKLNAHSGVYVCNDNDSDITITNADGAAFAYFLGGICAGDTGEGHNPVNGQVFTDDQGGYVSRTHVS